MGCTLLSDKALDTAYIRVETFLYVIMREIYEVASLDGEFCVSSVYLGYPVFFN
jgi:hypothetical protein